MKECEGEFAVHNKQGGETNSIGREGNGKVFGGLRVGLEILMDPTWISWQRKNGKGGGYFSERGFGPAWYGG